MISYEQALEKALKVKSNVDCCVEYDTAFRFGVKKEESEIGADPCIILKKTGEIIPIDDYFNDYSPVVIKNDLMAEKKQEEQRRIAEEKRKEDEEKRRIAKEKWEASGNADRVKKIVKIIFLFFGINVVIHTTAAFAALFGLIPIPIIGFILLMPFLLLMYFLTSIMVGCNFLVWLKHFFFFILIAIFGHSFLDILKVIVGYGNLAAIVGFPIMVELMGWINVAILFGCKLLYNAGKIDWEIFNKSWF